MGDKGKKDKNKGQKQNIAKQQQKAEEKEGEATEEKRLTENHPRVCPLRLAIPSRTLPG